MRRALALLALVVSAGAMIATSGPSRPVPNAETFWWQLPAAASRRIAWGKPGGHPLMPEPQTYASMVRVELESPPGRFRVELGTGFGRAVDGYCKDGLLVGEQLEWRILFAQMSSDLWGDFEGRCLGLCPTAPAGVLEFSCTEERCRGAAELPVQVHHAYARVDQSSDICVAALISGPAREREHTEPPEGLTLTVTLAPLRELVTGADGGAPDAGLRDASFTPPDASDAGVLEPDDAGQHTAESDDGGSDGR